MAKLSRNQLKDLVKECLVEIMTEGLGSAVSEISEKRSPRPSRRPDVPPPRFPQTRTPPQMTSGIRGAVQGLTSDPIMREIFEDTAMKTLQEQMAADRPGAIAASQGGDGPGVDLEDLGVPNNHWATLAFASPARK